MQSTSRTLSIVAVCVLCVGLCSAPASAQYPRPVDGGQQYWNNYWQWHNQQYAPAARQTATYQPYPTAQPTVGYQNVGSYYPTGSAPQKPFSGYQPAPNAYQRYWPLMVYPNGIGGWY